MNIKKIVTTSAAAVAILGLAACSAGEPAPSNDPAPNDPGSREETFVEGDNDMEAETWEIEINDTQYVVDPMEEGPFSPGDIFSLEGTEAVGIITPGAETPEDIEEFNTANGYAPDEYDMIRLDVDNRDGTEKVNINGLELFSEDGESFEYSDAFLRLDDFGPTMTEDYDYVDVNGEEISEEKYDSLNGMLYGDIADNYQDSYVQPGEKTTVWMIGPELPDSYTGIILSDSYYDPAALPATEK